MCPAGPITPALVEHGHQCVVNLGRHGRLAISGLRLDRRAWNTEGVMLDCDLVDMSVDGDDFALQIKVRLDSKMKGCRDRTLSSDMSNIQSATLRPTPINRNNTSRASSVDLSRSATRAFSAASSAFARSASEAQSLTSQGLYPSTQSSMSIWAVR